MFQKDMKYSLLLDFYGDILSERKREIIELYYNEDLSLSEIAEHAGISRQGVRDQIKHAEEEFDNLERKLGLVAKFGELRSVLKEIEEKLREMCIE